MKRWVQPGGVLVAVLGFAITRFVVAESVRTGDSLSFLVAGLVPLVLGLGLTVYGVVLAVGPFSATYVNTIAGWGLAGAVVMAVALSMTAIDPLLTGAGVDPITRGGLLAANVLLGGTIGGVAIGTRSATASRQRLELKRQANQARLLDRLLRHEVINAATIVDGHAELLEGSRETRDRSVEEIRSAARRIVATIDEVGELIDVDEKTSEFPIRSVLSKEIDELRSQGLDVTVEFDPGGSEDAAVAADHRVELLFRELLENAAENATSRVSVTVAPNGHEVSVTISDDGPGLPPAQQRLLRSGAFPEYDDPSAGFGLQIVRLLTVRYTGRIDLDEGIGDAGQSITVTLPRAGVDRGPDRPVVVSFPNLYRASVAGVLAGVVMGAFFSATTDLLPVIGALYGIENPVVGWITHIFHSVVFALVFAAVGTHPSVERWLQGGFRTTMAGVVWGTGLWIGAAGLVMPLWLRAVGIQAPIPDLPNLGLVSHAIWGLVLGGTFVLLEEIATRE